MTHFGHLLFLNIRGNEIWPARSDLENGGSAIARRSASRHDEDEDMNIFIASPQAMAWFMGRRVRNGQSPYRPGYPAWPTRGHLYLFCSGSGMPIRCWFRSRWHDPCLAAPAWPTIDHGHRGAYRRCGNQRGAAAYGIAVGGVGDRR